ncbi:hypothetical protein HDV03_001365 [Kappamyces sp. JEL0829]|nr:hypothetical protein HDV03_001365 [Kappamyces sp. JEL0829]
MGVGLGFRPMISFIVAATIAVAQASVLVNDIVSCPSLTPRSDRPASVQDVRPDDIKVVAALGDSITAGFLSKGLANSNGNVGIGDLIEYRGTSFSIGGDQGLRSVGNLLGNFNPNIQGRSVGQHGYPLFGGYTPSVDKFNGAVTGAKVAGIPNQISWLTSQIKSNKAINFSTDYKLLTLFIGANDVCQSCSTAVNPDTYETQVRSIIESLRSRYSALAHSSLPNLIVNVPQLFNVSQLYDLTGNSTYCDKQRANTLTAECTCAFLTGTNGAVKRKAMDDLTATLNARLVKIRNDYVAKNYSNFMMTTDPGVGGFSLAKADLSFLSNTDCFHPSVKAHGLLATLVWNNLFLPYAKKQSVVTDLNIGLACPTDSSRFQA